MLLTTEEFPTCVKVLSFFTFTSLLVVVAFTIQKDFMALMDRIEKLNRSNLLIFLGRMEGRQSGVSRAAQSAPTVRQVPAKAGTDVRSAFCKSEQVIRIEESTTFPFLR